MSDSYWPSEAIVRLRDRLADRLIDLIPADDPSRVSVVKLGQLQEDITKLRIAVEVHENDPDAEIQWHHNLVELRSQDDNRQFRGTIGSARTYWNRRFSLLIQIYLRNLNREEANAIKGQVMARVEQLLLDEPTLGGLTDSRGEQAINGQIVRESGILSGNSRLPFWRHKLWLQFLTTRPR